MEWSPVFPRKRTRSVAYWYWSERVPRLIGCDFPGRVHVNTPIVRSPSAASYSCSSLRDIRLARRPAFFASHDGHMRHRAHNGSYGVLGLPVLRPLQMANPTRVSSALLTLSPSFFVPVTFAGPVYKQVARSGVALTALFAFVPWYVWRWTSVIMLDDAFRSAEVTLRVLCLHDRTLPSRWVVVRLRRVVRGPRDPSPCAISLHSPV